MARERFHSWLASNGDVIDEESSLSSPGSGNCVTLVRLESGQRVVLKEFASVGKFDQTMHARSKWVSHASVTSPKVLFSSRQDRCVASQWVGGQVGDSVEFSEEIERRIYAEAGKQLRRLHGCGSLPVTSGMSISAAMIRRLKSARQDAENLVPVSVVKLVSESVSGCATQFDTFDRVPCHRDYWRRNWIISREGEGDPLAVSVIDFEHARFDFWMMDLVKMLGDQWLDRPDLASAFWDNYGVELQPDHHVLLWTCAALHSLQSMAWAHRNRDRQFVAMNRRLLDQALTQFG